MSIASNHQSDIIINMSMWLAVLCRYFAGDRTTDWDRQMVVCILVWVGNVVLRWICRNSSCCAKMHERASVTICKLSFNSRIEWWSSLLFFFSMFITVSSDNDQQSTDHRRVTPPRYARYPVRLSAYIFVPIIMFTLCFRCGVYSHSLTHIHICLFIQLIP